ncbi:MAG TPA: aromatic amino acid lyase, partial [Lysobacter sp.]|nr:aromatic amino acid lyase [Lysobacter sp.]
AEDHVSMGANEARHVLAMTDDLAKVLALELMTAAQALDLRRDMINAARGLAGKSDAEGFAAKVRGEPKRNDEAHAAYLADIEGLRTELAAAGEFGPGPAIAAAHAAIRERIGYLERDRALDGDVRMAVQLVDDNSVLDAVRAAVNA